MAILAGPENSGKEALVEKLADTLSGRSKNKVQLQMLTGHPWWAKGDNLVGLVEFQTRLTFEMVVRIFEEAQRPQNCDKVFLVCFARISPAELQNFFTDLAFQIRNNRIMRLGDVHFNEPFAFPNNVSIIGTMNMDDYHWWNADLLSQASIIQVEKHDLLQITTSGKTGMINMQELLAPIRDSSTAYKRLKSLLTGEKQPFGHFLQIQEIMHKHNVSAPNNLMDDAVMYLANAWSKSGEGFFATDLRTNFEIATDILITQLLSPFIQDAWQASSEFRQEMLSILQLYYPRSYSLYLNRFP